MADEKVEEGKVAGTEDEQALKAELEADGELLDDAGKPLPWNHPKRIRQIYKQAKEGRQATRAFQELGLKPSDTTRVKADLQRLEQFDAAYAEYQEQQDRGLTEPDEDAEAAKARQGAEKIRKQLRALGVKFDDPEDPRKEAAKAHDSLVADITRQSNVKINEALEEAGYDLDGMDADDRKDLVAEIDFKVGQKLTRNEEAKQAVLGGSMRPIVKFIQEVLESLGGKKPKLQPKGTGISKLPPRAGSTTGSASHRKVDTPAPKNVREATAQMVADLKARRQAAARGEE